MEINNQIVLKKTEEMEYIQFKRLLSHGIKHAYALKANGINFRSGCDLEKDSFLKLYNAIGLDVSTFVKPLQKHTGNVRCIGKVHSKEELSFIDGLITDKKGITLTTTNADCILMLAYDPRKKVIANVHSGWKGTFQKIIERTILKMIKNYRCSLEDIECYICPSIRKCHFEVSEDVKELCEDIFDFIPNKDRFISKGRIKDGEQKYFIDTIYINKYLLMELGIKEKNIIDSEICSVCNSDKINSYRADGENFKLSSAIISLD
ncbi:MAG: polyphenol oxidase family protein [Clostridia bacterium]|nr:polyphenol oxidase family protein [Clostridia bacterium]